MGGGIHITGAAGAGTSTLGALLAARRGWGFAETDDALWLPTDPPYRELRPASARIPFLRARLTLGRPYVLSGAVLGWGEALTPEFRLVVFLDTPTELRLARLRAREHARFGAAVAPGGERRAEYLAFLAWAASYEDGTEPGRSRARHEEWFGTLPCPLLRLEGTLRPDELARRTEAALEKIFA
jgi:adenylate kinase family enzyme